MAIGLKTMKDIRDKFDFKIVTPDGKEVELDNCRVGKLNLDFKEMQVPKTDSIVSRENLWRFEYPHKSKRRRLIKKWAKQNGYTYKKSLGFTITFSDLESQNVMEFFKEFGPKFTKVK